MVALRKDVKLGLTIGAIVLSVIGVYAGLSALAGDHSTAPPDGSTDGITLADAGTGSTSKTDAADPGITKPAATRITGTGATPSPTDTSVSGTSTGAAGPSIINPQAPIAAKPGSGASASTGDPWETAFRQGEVAAPVTVSPEPGSRSSGVAGTGASGTPKPSDVIKELNTPTPPAGQPAPRGDGVATAGDGSGSIATPPGSSQLTRTGTSALPTTPGQTHTVAAGDSLSSISAEYYGNGNFYQLIADANPQVNPNRLKVGTVINVPARAASRNPTTAPAARMATADTKIDPSTQYVVKAGDSLYKIAETLYGDGNSWRRLADTNRGAVGADGAKLKPGMILTLPTPPSGNTATATIR